MRSPRWMILLCLAALIPASLRLGAQMLVWASPSAAAEEEFRFGLQAFHRGFFNEAILSLEKSLAQSPAEPLTSFWLARTYARSGFEATAAGQLEGIAAAGLANPFCLSLLERLRARIDYAPAADYSARLVETGAIPNKAGRETTYLRPSWLSPAGDGSYWLCSFGSDAILRMDLNGVIREKYKGPLGGLDRPFCAIPDGSGGLIVSEFGGDRISYLDSAGRLKSRIGSKGRGDGQFVGPQYLCRDEAGYLYVSDLGNRRVSKFDPGGAFVLSFGQKTGGFEGFLSPAGLAFAAGRLFVADSSLKRVFAFDRDGNFLGPLEGPELIGPEGLYAEGERLLIVADRNRVIAMDTLSGAQVQLYQGQERSNRLICAMPDSNGGLIACDFDASKVLYLSEPGLVYSGFDVSVMRVNADAFPSVDAEILVRDAKGRPVNGLDGRNFYITEQIASIEDRLDNGKLASFKVQRIQPPLKVEFLGSGDVAGFDSVLAFDSSESLKNAAILSRDILASNIEAVLTAGQGRGAVYGAKAPVFDTPGASAQIVSRLAGAPSLAEWNPELSLRMAASKLTSARPRREIFLYTAGQSGETSFKTYGLAETSAFLINNAIHLNIVLVSQGTPDPSLRYLCESSGGSMLSLTDPSGPKNMIARIASRPTGFYSLRFTSQARSDFGKAYLPFAVEAYLFKRSGRDESGYFAPLR